MSTDAEACPHCGCPGSKIKSKSSCMNCAGIIVLIVFCVGLYLNSEEKKSSGESVATEQYSTLDADVHDDTEREDASSLYTDNTSSPSGEDESDVEEVEMTVDEGSNEDEGMETSEINASDMEESSTENGMDDM